MPRPTNDTLIQTIVALQWGPKTAEDLSEFTGMSPKAVRAYLRNLHEAGVIRVVERRALPMDPKTGCRPRGRRILVYGMQAVPYGAPDADEVRSTIRRRAKKLAALSAGPTNPNRA